MSLRWLAICLACLGLVPSFAAEPIKRVLPPAGKELPAEKQSQLNRRLRELVGRTQPHLEHPQIADVGVLLKAVDLALRHGEFYGAKDADKALRVLQLAEERIEKLATGKVDWLEQRGRVVRGFTSSVDGSYQPYGLVVPDDVDLATAVPLYVWLHGRGDQQTDLHFIHERLDRDGQIKPPGAIVVHPFGRQCLGFKSAGETDVLEAIAHVQTQYKIDPQRIVLMGFSMGGAGAWHLGAHYTDRFVAISPGAGFAETARYTNLKRENYPPTYEQTLWGVYDVPNYTRNLFNRPVIVYSGELDKQIQAARVMEEAFREHGRELPHLIGPQMGHKYHPETLQELLEKIHQHVAKGKPLAPSQVTLQTRTLRYNRMDWVEVLGLEEHWRDTRVDARLEESDGTLHIATRNVTRLKLALPWKTPVSKIVIDESSLPITPGAESSVTLAKHESWQIAAGDGSAKSLAKRPGLQGPIDDAFLEPFLVVLPTQSEPEPQIDEWVKFELQHFRDRWRGVFRGELRVKRDSEVTEQDMQRYHLVVWGTPASNSLLKRLSSEAKLPLPVKWAEDAIVVGEERFAAAQHVPLFCYPNPLQPERYLVVNSGPTFREAHDRTNSMQNPKLPDWAVVDVTQPPSAEAPGKVAAADFFDEAWRLRPRTSAAQ